MAPSGLGIHAKLHPRRYCCRQPSTCLQHAAYPSQTPLAASLPVPCPSLQAPNLDTCARAVAWFLLDDHGWMSEQRLWITAYRTFCGLPQCSGTQTLPYSLDRICRILDGRSPWDYPFPFCRCCALIARFIFVPIPMKNTTRCLRTALTCDDTPPPQPAGLCLRLYDVLTPTY